MKNNTNTLSFIQKSWVLLKALVDKRTPWVPKAIGILIIAYIILPFDFLSDYIPVAGWLDDLTLAALGIFIISKIVPNEILKEYINEESGDDTPPDKTLPPAV
jgi:uncharacterized membrane protein YkvA (DUF1232 family)